MTIRVSDHMRGLIQIEAKEAEYETIRLAVVMLSQLAERREIQLPAHLDIELLKAAAADLEKKG